MTVGGGLVGVSMGGRGVYVGEEAVLVGRVVGVTVVGPENVPVVVQAASARRIKLNVNGYQNLFLIPNLLRPTLDNKLKN